VTAVPPYESVGCYGWRRPGGGIVGPRERKFVLRPAQACRARCCGPEWRFFWLRDDATEAAASAYPPATLSADGTRWQAAWWQRDRGVPRRCRNDSSAEPTVLPTPLRDRAAARPRRPNPQPSFPLADYQLALQVVRTGASPPPELMVRDLMIEFVSPFARVGHSILRTIMEEVIRATCRLAPATTLGCWGCRAHTWCACRSSRASRCP
jgi:hypothetical protein